LDAAFFSHSGDSAEGGEVFSSNSFDGQVSACGFAAEASGGQAAAGEGHPSGYVKPQGRVGTDAFWYLGGHSSFPSFLFRLNLRKVRVGKRAVEYPQPRTEIHCQRPRG
jgi:hypothetical protein